MREVAFIEQNKEKWTNFEQSFFNAQQEDPESLANSYIELVNDLAFAQTFYPDSKTTAYLNQIAANAYLSIYKTKRVQRNRFLEFFIHDVPQVVYKYRRQVAYSFIFFFIFVLIGAVSTATDDTYVRMILGDAYVNQTQENIKNGNPVAVYDSHGEFGMFVYITFNNIYVAIRCFLFGIFAGLGTGLMLMYNGIMLGSFQYMFHNEGVLIESMKGIWIHGAMEIFAIIIAGASGFILASSILFPKTYSRFQSFKRGFKDGLKVLIATIPFFVMAGFLEGFVTRYSKDMSNAVACIIIFGSLALITFYFIIYPYIYHRKHRDHAAV